MAGDEPSGGWGAVAGLGVFLMYLAALVPGLLAILLLTVAFALPLLLPALSLVILVAPFWVIRKLVRAREARRLMG
jgi:hypothetical protein